MLYFGCTYFGEGCDSGTVEGCDSFESVFVSDVIFDFEEESSPPKRLSTAWNHDFSDFGFY